MIARFTSITELTARRVEWQALCDRAIDPNPFYGPDYLIASERALHPDNPIRILIVECDGVLSALFPLEKPVLRDLLFGRAWRMYRNDYTCLGTPLLAPEHPEQVLASALNALQNAPGPKRLILPQLPATGAVHASILSASKNTHRALTVIAAHERASVTTELNNDAYAHRHWSKSRRKAHARRHKALAENGSVVKRGISGNSAEYPEALEAFLRLEASGWKGKTGTALADSPQSLAFARQAYGSTNCWIESLECAGRPVAMALFVHAQGTAYNVKVAYDEDFANQGPGVLLDGELIALATQGGPFRVLDSCALPGHPVEALWHERIAMADIVLGLTPQHSTLSTSALSSWIRFVAKLKAMRHAKSYSSKPATI